MASRSVSRFSNAGNRIRFGFVGLLFTLSAVAIGADVTSPAKVAASELESVAQAPGLKIDKSKIKLLGKYSQDLPVSIKPLYGEIRIRTGHTGLIALARLDEKSDYQLRLFSSSGSLISKFQVDSWNINIPRDKDVLWVLGRPMPKPDPRYQHSRVDRERPHHQPLGLYEYDFFGNKLFQSPPGNTGGVSLLRLADDGSAYVGIGNNISLISSAGRELAKFSVRGGVMEDGFEVFNGGDFLAMRTKEAFLKPESHVTLYDKTGHSLAEFDGADHGPIVGVSRDGKYLVITNGSSRRVALKIYAVNSIATPIREFEVPFYVFEAIPDDSLQHFFVLRPAIGGDGHFAFDVIDSSGAVQAERICDEMRRYEVRMSVADDHRSASWSCGDVEFDVGITSGTP